MGYYTDYTLSYEIPEEKERSEISEFREKCRLLGIDIPVDIRSAVDNRFKLEVELEKALDEDDSCSYGKISQFITGDADSCKWYEHDEDMKRLSNRFPTVLFTLEGKGEESGDIWIKYFKGGKSQRVNAKIVFDPYDESKLE
jgi:hypothetical protein